MASSQGGLYEGFHCTACSSCKNPKAPGCGDLSAARALLNSACWNGGICNLGSGKLFPKVLLFYSKVLHEPYLMQVIIILYWRFSLLPTGQIATGFMVPPSLDYSIH